MNAVTKPRSPLDVASDEGEFGQAGLPARIHAGIGGRYSATDRRGSTQFRRGKWQV
ncbi:hypothetical protein D9M69_104790 [compost metagenome]